MLNTQNNHTKYIIEEFNAERFGAGEVVNATNGYVNAGSGAVTAYTDGAGLSAELKTYYHDRLIDEASPELVHAQFGQKRPIPKNGGRTIEFRKYSSFPKLTSPLAEGVTPSGQKMNVTVVTETPLQYGGYVELSDMLITSAVDSNIIEATNLIGAQAGRTLDGVIREKINAGTQVQYAEGKKTARNLLVGGSEDEESNDYMTVDTIRMAVRTLQRQNAKKIDGSYVAIIHPDVAFDLMSDKKWEEPKAYCDPKDLYEGEIGRIAGVRFVMTSEAKIFAKAGADSRDVYSTLVIGEGAYGVTEITGLGLQHIVKQLGTGGGSDPLDQRATVGWKATLGAALLMNPYMVRIETTSRVSNGEAN